MREIGSEFWNPSRPASKADAENVAYLLSGRTALRYIIDDIRKTRLIRKVLLPSYCCESMIMPFVQAGISVDFYRINRDNIDYPFENNADIVLLVDFFGYVLDQNREIARFEKKKGTTIVYDSTHKINGNEAVNYYADYTFCSYRKWAYCNFAIAVNNHGVFANDDSLMQHGRYLSLRENAAMEKARYITGLHCQKQKFLEGFSAAEQLLDEDYIGYVGTPIDLDFEQIVLRRRENSAYLIEELKKIPQINLWREKLGTDDVPMFVPILVDPEIRGELQRHLISEQIYCPIHWPKSSYHGACNELYDMELSLICDQRYDISDMERMIQVIKNYFSR